VKAQSERLTKRGLLNTDGFVRRVLSEHEQALFANKGDSAAYCAKRFAAKEAFAKALGTGIGRI
jgi:holo-[acyl-carrier protein] synthase